MGTILDTSVLIEYERGAAALPVDDDLAVAAISLSELLQGVLRGAPRRRGAREAFVANLLVHAPIVPFTEEIARVHAQLWAHLEKQGTMIGGHDLQIAATAIALGWELATRDRRDFSRVPGLKLAGA